jgi:hypothetical protein
MNMNCFGCNQSLDSTPQQLQSGQWVAQCAACGITNKLEKDAEVQDRFSVSGALISVQRDGKQ